MPPTKRGTNVIILKVVKFIFPKMSHSMKQSLSFLVLSFRDRIFKKLRTLSCHLFLCCRISFLERMTKTLCQHHYQRRIMRTNIWGNNINEGDPAGNSNVGESLCNTLCPVFATVSPEESPSELSLQSVTCKIHRRRL